MLGVLTNRFGKQNSKVRRISKQEILKKGLLYNFAEQDQVDLISYSGLEENATYLQIGDKFARTLFISGYP